MGKLEREAKHVTVGNLERGRRFGQTCNGWKSGKGKAIWTLEDWQTGAVFWVVSGVIFSLVVLHAVV